MHGASRRPCVWYPWTRPDGLCHPSLNASARSGADVDVLETGYAVRLANLTPRWLVWVGRSHPESRLAVQRGLRFAQWPRGIDLRPSCRPPTGRCVGRTHSLRSLRDAKARSVNGPLHRCRREPGHLLLLVPPLRVRAQRTRIGTVPVQRMPMSVFLPHGRKDGTPDPEVVRADGRGQVS